MREDRTMKQIRAIAITTVLLLLLAGEVLPQNRMARSVFGCGGFPVSDGSRGISSTVGQPLVGRIGASLQRGRIGFWYTAISGPVSVEEPPALPSDRLVLDNYPNPFRDRTTLRFYLPLRSAVTVEVFDVLGRKLAEFSAVDLHAGVHEMHLDRAVLPMQTGGARLYYCRLSARGHSVVHAMIRRD